MKIAVRTMPAIVVCVSIACAHKPPDARPASVPPEATFVSGGKSGASWQMCRLANAGDTIYCRIWNEAGSIVYDDQFVPLDGSAVPTIEQLQIDRQPLSPGPDRVVLKDGRVLVPKSTLPGRAGSAR